MGTNGTALARIADATGYNRAQVELIKDTIAKGASDDELMLFLHLAQRTGLDPFSKQIYLIKRWDSDSKREVMTPQTGIDGLRLIADRTDRYTPGRAPTFEYDDSGMLFSATAYIKKFVRGEWHEIAATAHYGEYVQLKKDGNPNKFWAEKPHIMLAKCAEALALRRAFPSDMGGVYTSDEMRDDPVVVAPAITAPPRPAALPVDTSTGEVLDAECMTADEAAAQERDQAIKAMREAAKKVKRANPDVVLPGKDDVAVMTVESIRALTEAMEGGYYGAQPAEAGADVEPVKSGAPAEMLTGDLPSHL